MPQPLHHLYLSLLTVVLVSCGSVQAVFGHKGSKDPQTSTPMAPEAPASNPHALVPAGANEPLKTSLAAGTVIPSQLKAQSLRLSFTASDRSAAFACQTGPQQPWLPCNAGAAYDFGRLAPRQSYTLYVRAHTADGRIEATPLLVAFATDLLGGLPPTLPDAAGQSLSVHVTLPSTAADLTPSPAAPLSLQVGSFYALTVPASAQVTGYATDKTYNAVAHILERLPIGGTILGAASNCTATYQRITQATDGTQFCDSTPPQADTSLPHNFTEIALNKGASHEALLVAAVDSSTAKADPAALRLSIASRCQGAVTGGQSQLPLLNLFYGTAPQRQSLVWCFTKPLAGRSQWLAMALVPLTTSDDGPALRLLYAIDAGPALNTAAQFTDRVRKAVVDLLQPISPAS